MSHMFVRVRGFMLARGQDAPEAPSAPPDAVVRQRCRWQLEETLELLSACFPSLSKSYLDCELEDVVSVVLNEPVSVDLVAYADANADIRYVAYGNDIAAGIDGRETDAEVARSNDTKGPCAPDGKVSKGPTYSPPDIAGILKDQGWKERL